MNEVRLVKLPGSRSSIRYRWIVRKRDDGRYIVRAPKIGVRIRDLALLRPSDYGKESLLPIDSIIMKKGRKTRRKTRRKTQRKTRRN